MSQNFVKRLATEISHPGDGFRLPGELGTQRTALLPQSVRVPFAAQASRDLVLCRDSVFPLWGESLSAQTECYQLAWMGDQKSAATGYAGAEYIQMDCSEVAAVWSGPSGNQVTRFQNTYVAPVAVPVAVFPEQDSMPWLFVPSQAQHVIGFNMTVPITGSAKANITFERAISSEYPLSELTLFNFPVTAGAGSAAREDNLTVDIPSAARGCWVRCKRIDWETTAPTSFGGAYQPMVVVAIVATGAAVTIATPTASADLPAISGGTSTSMFKPIVNLDSSRSSITASAPIISRANRVVGTSLEIINTTKMLDVDGYFTCATFPESGAFSIVAPPSDSSLSTILDSDKFTTRMANSVYTFVKPGREISQFQDSRFEFVGYGGTASNTLAMPVINMYGVACYNLIRCVDVDGTSTTQLLLTLRSVIEFVTNDILLRPQYPQGTLVDTQMAVNTLRNTTPFWVTQPGQVHKLVNYDPLPGAPRKNGQRRRNRPPPPVARQPKKKAVPKPPAQPAKKKGGLSMFLASNPESRGHKR